jgi:hypothetical protein
MQNIYEVWSLVQELALSLPPSLWAVGIGFKEQEEVFGEDLSIVFFAHTKRDLKDLDHSETVPPDLNGIHTDVRNASRVLHVESAADRFDPLVGGVRMTATGKRNYDGTLSSVFRDRTTGQLVAITNNHVVGFRFGIDSWLHGQSSRIDGFQPAEASLDDFGIVIKRSSEPDCAAVRLNLARSAPGGTLLRDVGRGQLRVNRISDPNVGDQVFKIGARTDYTEGRVTAISPNGVEISPRRDPSEQITAEGDSGSLWCRWDGNEIAAVALHHSGNRRGPSRAYAAPMTRVAATLDIDVI